MDDIIKTPEGLEYLKRICDHMELVSQWPSPSFHDMVEYFKDKNYYVNIG